MSTAMHNLSPYDVPLELLAQAHLIFPFDRAWIKFDADEYKAIHGAVPLYCRHEFTINRFGEIDERPTRVHLRGNVLVALDNSRWACVMGQCRACETIYYTIPGGPL